MIIKGKIDFDTFVQEFELDYYYRPLSHNKEIDFRKYDYFIRVYLDNELTEIVDENELYDYIDENAGIVKIEYIKMHDIVCDPSWFFFEENHLIDDLIYEYFKGDDDE